MTDQVRWFEALGKCGCGKQAVGAWRGPRNESYGIACLKCGNARVIRAEREREIEARRSDERPTRSVASTRSGVR